MDERFKIYVESLRDGHVEKIEEAFVPDFMDVQEADLTFTKDILVDGEVYLAEDDLVLHLNITAYAIIPCSICNEPVEAEAKITGCYLTVPPEDFRSGLYYYGEALREIILLEMPHFAECENGNCPKRKEISQYLKTEEGQHPFADLNWEDMQKNQKDKKI